MNYDWLGETWVGIMKGIQFVVGFQLVIVTFLLLFFNKRNKLPLAIICYIIGEFFFKRLLWNYWPDVDLLVIICGGRKEIFLFPLTYFLLIQLIRKLTIREVLKHLLFPFGIYLFYAISRIFFNTFFKLNYDPIKEVYFIAVLVFIIVYYRIIKQLLPEIKQKVLPKAYKKYYIFFLTLFTFYMVSITTDIFSHILWKYVFELDSSGKVIVNNLTRWLYDFNEGSFFYFGFYILTPIHYLLALGLFLFTLSELPIVKKYFLPKDIEQKTITRSIDTDFKARFETLLIQEKAFKNSDFKIEDCVIAMNCSKTELVYFIKQEYDLSFSNYLNNLKIEEFKLNLNKPENDLFDIASIAKISGFKSKATFYRIFKAKEGITPQEFKNKTNFY